MSDTTGNIIENYFIKDEKGYKCIYCNKYPKVSGRSNYNLKQHYRRNHLNKENQSMTDTDLLTFD